MIGKKTAAISLLLSGCLLLSACGQGSGSAESAEETAHEDAAVEALDMSAWQYNEEDDVYYQTGVSYCADPADASIETLAVFVPGAYMDGTDNGDGTFTCTLNESGEVAGYTAKTAPIVMPINTPGYSSQAALTEYTDVTEYTGAGFVYVHAGCRGRDAGAPAGVTDLKSAVRWLRYSSEDLAGDTDSIFTFGMSGGGAQSAIMGATGDSELYDAYLEQIGAVMSESDAVCGSMCWCPITNLDSADEAYEWMMGNTRSDLSEEDQQISDALASAYVDYINDAGIADEEGNILTLDSADSGSYYDYLVSVIEGSLNTFLANTTFPYDASSSSGKSGGMGGNMAGGPPSGKQPDGAGTMTFEEMDDITRTDSSSGVSLSGTYETAQDYIDALNANGEWVTYDETTNTATVTSMAGFTAALKTASKNLGAFDQLDAGQGENTLFGYGDGSGAHFDSVLAEILSDLGSDYAESYASDLERTDSVGNTVETRVNMYTPLYYLLESEEGYGTSKVADFWRIRTGLNQGDTALSTEVNLALALENTDSVRSVDFATVWGEGHTQAETDGDSTTNFISWVNNCMTQK